MRFTLMLSRGEYRDFLAIAQAAEACGWTSITIPDSLFFPQTTVSRYPYADTDNIRQYIAATPFVEPFIAMSWMAAVTTTLRFYPAVMKVPVRQPLVLAKALSSLAVISGNRVSLGAGLSPWREDFSYNGLDFEKRGRLMDECIEVIRAAMSGRYFEFHSQNYDIGPIKLNPVPDRPVPILYGGHSKAALARAARLCDGWISANADTDTLKAMIGQLNALRERYGTRGRPDFEIHVMDVTASSADDYRRLADLGATDMVAGFASEGQEMIDNVRRFGEKIIAKLGSPRAT
ncbi:MAG: TIGR03619 family F420-dependent LLM class oxidoreductase [Deltaproteobacteria bacterium]|nr:TIGR03619 family F420-dependent LLM class oxidoreductase [Deltaproteobacteria bacterium]